MIELFPGIYGALNLKTHFDYMDWIDKGTYLRHFLDANVEYFPKNGVEATLYFTDLNYTKDMQNIVRLVEELKSRESDILLPGSVTSWHTTFVQFANTINGKSINID